MVSADHKNRFRWWMPWLSACDYYISDINQGLHTDNTGPNGQIKHCFRLKNDIVKWSSLVFHGISNISDLLRWSTDSMTELEHKANLEWKLDLNPISLTKINLEKHKFHKIIQRSTRHIKKPWKHCKVASSLLRIICSVYPLSPNWDGNPGLAILNRTSWPLHNRVGSQRFVKFTTSFCSYLSLICMATGS